MIFKETSLKGAFLITLEPKEDERGFFARTFDKKEMAMYGLETEIVQCNISYNKKKGTLRGMHYQKKPFEEAKYVQCNRGAVYDVIVDLRLKSKTYKQWASFELTEKNRRILYVPKGFAHGFLTLADNTELNYQMTEFFHEKSAVGVRWNNPLFGIRWPNSIKSISTKDDSYPILQP